MEIDSSSQPTPASVPCPPLNGLHHPILGEGDGSRLREMLEGVDTSRKRSLPLDFMSSKNDGFLEAPSDAKRPRMDKEELNSADRSTTTISNFVTLNRRFETSNFISHGASSTQRLCEEKPTYCNDLNSAPIFRSVLFGETSSKHFDNYISNPPPPAHLSLGAELKHEQVSELITIDHRSFDVTHDHVSTNPNPPPMILDPNPNSAVISCSDPFHDPTGDLSLQVCTSLDEVPTIHHGVGVEQGKQEEEELRAEGEQARDRRQSARMAAMKLSRKEMMAERKRLREEEKAEKQRKKAEQQEKKKQKALEVAERKRLRQEEKMRKAAEMEEKRRRRAIEQEERKRRKEAEEELKRRRMDELQERLRQREEERERLRRQQQEAKAKKEEEKKKQKAPVKKRKKPEAAHEDADEGEDGWKKNAGLTLEDREKIPLGPMSGVERVFSWLFGKHSDNADLPPYLPLNEELNRILPQLQVETLTDSQNALKE